MASKIQTKILRRLTPVAQSKVMIDGGFWGERLRVNREVTLPIEYKQCKDTGRIDAFRLGWKEGESDPPHVFWDSDLAKWVEGAAYSLATCPDAGLEKKLLEVVDLIVSAQQDDGYLNTHFTVVEPEKRWTNLRDRHELYCAGHLMEAATAHYEATGKDNFLRAMCRYADYIDTVFGRGRGKKRGYPGHEEIELALVKLYRATGQGKYLQLAKFFVDERGRKPHYFDREARLRNEDPGQYNHGNYDYTQAHLPVREQKTAEGHAVRACYLYAGMADVAAETGDIELLAACRKIWDSIVQKRLYIHGGVGSSRFGERFTLDYDLPNEEAYAETCAAIALVFFAHRMLQIDPDGRYADVMEQALYNGIISGVSLDGERFFYDNYLASRPGVHRFTRQKSPVRQEWFGCACCPPNIARLLASFGQYVYSQANGAVYVHLFAQGCAAFTLGRREVTLTQTTRYPWDGEVEIEVSPDSPAAFAVAVRIPGWCEGARVTVNGKRPGKDAILRKGYLKIRRRWEKGDKLELTLPMPATRVEAHPSVSHDCGRVALRRGPVLYCLEEKDNGKDLSDILLPRGAALKVVKGASGILKGVPVISAGGFRRDRAGWKGTLYRTSPSRLRPCRIFAIPYFMWANRGEGEMLVWIRDAD